MSPYSGDFSSFTPILPKPFRAANKQTFNATAKEELVVDVPNGVTPSQLRLTEVLYSPEVGYTLVSVGKLDDAGFDVTFSGGKCTIREKDGTVVGVVPKDEGGLYRLRRGPGIASSTE